MPKPSHSGAFQDSCLNTCVGTLADAETRQTNSKPRHTKARCPYAEPCSVQALDRSDTPIHHAAKRPAITSAHTPAWHITVSDARIRMLPLPPKPTPRSLPPLQSYSTTPHGIHNHSSTCPQRTENSAFQLSSVLHTHIHTRIPPGWAIIDTSAAAKSSTHMLPTTLLAGRCQTAQFKSSSTYSRHTGQLMAGCRCSTGFGHAHKQGNKAPRVKKAVNTSRHTSMAVHAMLNPRQKRHSLLQK